MRLWQLNRLYTFKKLMAKHSTAIPLEDSLSVPVQLFPKWAVIEAQLTIEV